MNKVKDLFERVPPASQEAEQGVLGCILLDSTALDKAADTLAAADFYREGHRQIYKAMQELANKGEPIDILTMVEALRQTDKLERTGGPAYIAGLPDMVPAAAHVGSYAKIVRDKAMLRAVITTAQEIAARAYEDTGNAEAFMDEAEQAIFAVTHNRSEKKIKTFQENTVETLNYINAVRKGDRLPGLMTGYKDIDDILAGLHDGDLIILAARPGIGKTALALNVMCKITIGTKDAGLYFSMEMAAMALTTRVLCASAKTDAQAVRKGTISLDDYDKMADKGMKSQHARLFIDDTPGLTIAAFKSKSRRMKSEHDIRLIVVDYLQLMRGERDKNGNRESEIAGIARELKGTARELNVPVFALSQLNRKVEDRSNPEPQLSDLRESGAIEQDADVVLFIYKPVPKKDELFTHNVRRIKIAKQRNGPTGSIDLLFDDTIGRFENYSNMKGENNG